MSEPVIDPSEIIIDQSDRMKKDGIRANPWMRLLARFSDYACFFFLLWGIKRLLHGHFSLGKFESFIPIEFFAWIPIEALLLSAWGTTPGKFFLKIKLRQGKRLRLPFSVALKRSFNVWLRGLGMMIPILNGICLLLAFYRLKTFQTTTWDREEHIFVTHASVGRWRIIAAAILSAGGMLYPK
ncbi:MAG TPA: RDD family protein [Chlamydiales bacterium]|nr:RDD family protein [Chlamydiales bacterium]